MAEGRRCAIGCETWPDEPLYSKCCVCGEDTRKVRGNSVTPLDPDEAESKKLHYEFERYYERRCQRRGIPSDGPLPENYARALGPLLPVE